MTTSTNTRGLPDAQQKDRRVILATAFAGLAALLLAIAQWFSFPSAAALSEGFKTPILALEFAKTEQDIAFLTGPGSAASTMRAQMRQGHKIDMVFPFAYGGLIALTLLGLARAGVRSAWPGLAVAVAIIPADLIENQVILDLLAALEQQQPPTALLGALHAATWFKWWCIALAAGLLALGAWQRKMRCTAALSAMTALALVLTWLSHEKGLVVEVMGIITAVFLIFIAGKAIGAVKRA